MLPRRAIIRIFITLRSTELYSEFYPFLTIKMVKTTAKISPTVIFKYMPEINDTNYNCFLDRIKVRIQICIFLSLYLIVICQISALKAEKRQRDQQRKQKISENRKHLANVRVVQKNLVFVVGLPPRLADAEVSA